VFRILTQLAGHIGHIAGELKEKNVLK